ncbi:MAG: hypothetical protein AB7G23_21420 [Vicinamibacterales bacterium]
MSAMSNYLETALFNEVLRATNYAPPTTVYVGLFTSDPTDAGTGTEVTGGAYARQAVTFGAPTDGAGSNSAAVTFPQATANWGTVSHFGIFDASTAGNLLLHGQLTASKTVNAGDVFTFPTGQLTVTFA